MVLVLAVPLSDPWLPLNALGVPLGGKGTAARAAKSCQGQAIASNCRQNPCILYLHFRVFGLSGCRVFRFSGSDSGQGPCKVHDSGLTGSESGHVVLALVVPLDTPWLSLVCPWGTKAHRHGQPRAAKGRLLCALNRQNTYLLHVLLIHDQVFKFSSFQFSGLRVQMHFQVFGFSGFREFGMSGFRVFRF